ncbi:ATPase [Roseibium aquae]|uniref:histidine kinase n=1 Tax=Roseibium aquae TaxID=1323746 RepID=A0A916TNA5_9HYPH|nr:ATP-binding protein [Roseibium aquae]GGB63234.1 ATPase [Roseibium aquae]
MTDSTGAAPGDAPRGKPARQPSLATRLVAVAAIWSALTLIAAAFVLVELYRTAGERAFDAQLDVYVKSLLSDLVAEGETAAAPTTLEAPRMLGEPRFSLPLSGWYWTIRDAGTDAVTFASPSLVGDPLVLPAPDGEGTQSGFTPGPTGDEVRFMQTVIEVGGEPRIIAVAIATEDFRAEVAGFARQVAITLFVIGLGLVGAVFLQVRVGLRPLGRLRESLSRVRLGEAERIDQDLPLEIAPLAIELNALITSNREIVERARTHVGNLAHGLKTPLSVIANEARAHPGPFADKVGEQAGIMQTQIQHHLDRARMAAQRRVIGVSCVVDPVMERLVRAMSKIYRDKVETLEWSGAQALKFRGEQQDLEEMAGNLLDNACKWSAGTVRVSARALTDEGGRDMAEIRVEDDGPGLSEEECREAVKRGRRLDETVPGTGLGLAIVADLAALYGGRLDLGRSELGGLEARLRIPAL